MKKLTYLLLSLLMLTVISCDKNSFVNDLTKDELPEKIKTFIDTYFGEAEFEWAQYMPYYGGTDYMVKLKEAYVHFDHEQEWLWIDFTGPMLPSAGKLLDEDVLKQLQELEKQGDAYEVRRFENYQNKEVQIRTRNGNVYIDAEGHTGRVLAQAIASSDLPEATNQFIQQFSPVTRSVPPMLELTYPQYIKFTTSETTFYRYRAGLHHIYLISVDFEENGRMFYIQEAPIDKAGLIANYFIKALPEGVVNRLQRIDESIVSQIRSINLFHDTKAYGFNQLYGFTLEDKSFHLIDSDYELVELPLDKVRTYVDQGFSPITDNYNIEVTTNSNPPYFYRNAFVITGWHEDPTLEINLFTNARGEMRRVSSGLVSTDPTQTTPLPRAVLEMLHHPIADYLDEHYPGAPAVAIDCAYQEDLLMKQPVTIDVRLSADKNLKTVVFDYATGEFIKDYLMVDWPE